MHKNTHVRARSLSHTCTQGTIYALIMSINNMGGIISSQIGAALTNWLGVTAHNLDNFWKLVLICNLSTLVPLVLISWIPVCLCLFVSVCLSPTLPTLSLPPQLPPD